MALMSILILFLHGIVLCYSVRNEAEERHWSYVGENGSQLWGQNWPMCSEGKKQSPVNINIQKVVLDENLEPLELKHYNTPLAKSRIENNGQTIEVRPEDNVVRKIVVDEKSYKLDSFHFHWGNNNSDGTEHTINGVKYTMEVHFVHRHGKNKKAIVAVLFQEEEQDNTSLEPIIQALAEVPYRHNKKTLEVAINLLDLIDDGCDFYRYEGSSGTPPCTENVIWSICKNPKSIGVEQMNQFRKLHSATSENCIKGCPLSGNVREVQPLNERVIYESDSN